MMRRGCGVLFLMLFFTTAHAIPGVSLLSVVQALTQQYAVMKAQLSQLKAAVKEGEGTFGYGNLGNGFSDLDQRKWSPDSWKDAIQALSGGNESRYRELLADYKKVHPTLSQNEYGRGASQSRVRSYAQLVQTNQIATVEGRHAFNTINTHLDAIHELSEKIDEAPSEKAAMDLNSRLVAELAYVSVQELKMQALLNQQLSQQSAMQVDGLTREALFNQLPSA